MTSSLREPLMDKSVETSRQAADLEVLANLPPTHRVLEFTPDAGDAVVAPGGSAPTGEEWMDETTQMNHIPVYGHLVRKAVEEEPDRNEVLGVLRPGDTFTVLPDEDESDAAMESAGDSLSRKKWIGVYAQSLKCKGWVEEVIFEDSTLVGQIEQDEVPVVGETVRE